MNRSQYYIMQKKHEDYLMHHGIDGQKWGVKHGPPYPLDDSKLKFLSERVITEKDGRKSTETMFANNNAWITVETNYDANGKVTSRHYSLDD